MIPSIIFVVKKLFLTSFILAFGIYFFSSNGATPYDYFSRLSGAFLTGKVYLTDTAPWLHELIPAGENKYYVLYPPMPAVVMMPFRSILGGMFAQDYLAYLLGAGMVVATMAIAWRVGRDKKLVVWSGVLVGVGTIIWFMAAVGSAWYVGQLTAAFFISAGLLEAISRKRPLIVGLFLGAGYLARLHTILLAPLFLYLLYRKNWRKQYALLALGVLPFILFNAWYNFSRFGVFWDKGYLLIPEVLFNPAYRDGVFNLSYIPRHLQVIFASLPMFFPTFPYALPSWTGLSIWITTPAFVYALFAPIKDRGVQFSWLSILLTSLVIFSHGTTGFAQFGYRFAVDFYPILLFLTIKGAATTGLRWHHWLLLAISIAVNLWGIYSMHLFGWPCC